MSDLGLHLVRTAGLEPALLCGKKILSLQRLPFRHVRSRDGRLLVQVGLQTTLRCASGAHVQEARCAPVLAKHHFRLDPNRNPTVAVKRTKRIAFAASSGGDA